MIEQNVITVTEFGNSLKSFIDDSFIFKSLKIKGEISNLVIKANSHIYFSLKDPGGKIDCAIWKSNVSKHVLQTLKEGSEIIANGSLSYYPPFNKLTFTVNNVIYEGSGTLDKLYEERYQEYQAKGYFDSKYKKPIPQVPTSIGVITSETGAAIQDILSTIKKRFPIANIYLFPVLVQGDDAKQDIAKKIVEANNSKIKVDVLLVGRGGGSYEDLWSFNEVEVIEAIHNSKIPIISCVGHESDITLADYVADLRVSTPTMAAVSASIDMNAMFDFLNSLIERSSNGLIHKLNEYKIKLNNIKETTSSALITKLNNIKQQFWAISREVELLSPYGPLNKGFALIMDAYSNKTIKTVDQLKKLKEIKIKMSDGEVSIKIEEVK
ncbi:exodeoxyribonuclease VII large subunit [Spiroplasma sp. TIUS-1]|uniref:exodeoxyribonuclease VII large subunit n=1 Tax=Spiroplasma sp. TIUS-1 TaxID=216963 RepID=UPI001397B684|nr:exodeoxyribonuclease VII large subunit [Spiroplasma sp. TIUS-1]QHX35922.1 exodeoxyribonuclease VII large subunit [Spiroplasma sp. TIUS-1]